MILETVSGRKEVPDACRELGINETAFRALRDRVLQSAVEDLEPKMPGRPKKTVSGEQEEIERLKAEVWDLKSHLEAANIREELRLILPGVLISPGESTLEKKRRRRREKREKQRLKMMKQRPDTSGSQGGTPA